MGYAVKLQKGGLKVTLIATNVTTPGNVNSTYPSYTTTNNFDVSSVYDGWRTLITNDFILAYKGIRNGAQWMYRRGSDYGNVSWSVGFSYSYDNSTGILTINNNSFAYHLHSGSNSLANNGDILLDIYVVK